MVMIFSWDPSSKIIFLHVALGERRGGGVRSVFSRFRRSFLDTLSGQDAAKRLCSEITGISKPYNQLFSCNLQRTQTRTIVYRLNAQTIYIGLIVHKLRHRHGIFPLKNEF